MSATAEEAMEKPSGKKLLSPQERLELVLLALAREQNLGQLCSQAGVSRALLYRWMHQMREAGLKALEAKKPGRKPRPAGPEAPREKELKERLEALQREMARLRKEKEHQELLAQTAQGIIRRRGWEDPAKMLKKNAGRRRRGSATSVSGNSTAPEASPPGPTPAAGASAPRPTGDGSGEKSGEGGRA